MVQVGWVKSAKIRENLRKSAKICEISGSSASVGVSFAFASCRMQFYPSESKKKKVATRNGNPTGSLFFGSLPPGMLKKEKIEQEQPRDMGQGMMTGSNTPWAQCPANFKESLQPSKPTYLGSGRRRVNPPPWELGLEVLGASEGLLLRDCLCRPRGQRPRRINYIDFASRFPPRLRGSNASRLRGSKVSRLRGLDSR